MKTDILQYIESQRIEKGKYYFKTARAAILSSLIDNTAQFENTIFVCGEAKLKFEIFE